MIPIPVSFNKILIREEVMERVDSAVSCFRKGYTCSQAIVSVYGALFGLDRATALKIASGFGGGMGRMATTCGAVTGAFMVVGLSHGATDPEDKESKETTHKLVRDFTGRFLALNGSIICKDLMGCDISQPEGLETVREKGLFLTLCSKFVKDSAEIIEDMIAAGQI